MAECCADVFGVTFEQAAITGGLLRVVDCARKKEQLKNLAAFSNTSGWLVAVTLFQFMRAFAHEGFLVLSTQLSRTKRHHFAFAVLYALVSIPTAAFAVQATLTGDAHISSARPAVNSGALSNLVVGNGYTTLLKFDFTTLPAGTSGNQITRAVLKVYCNRADTPGSVTVQALTSSFDESTVTYSTAPTIGSVVSSGPVKAADQFVTFDITAEVQAWIADPSTNYGLALSSVLANLQFDSKENDQTGHAPQLEVALAAGSSTPGPAGPQGPTGLQGPIGLTGSTGAIGPQGPAGLIGAPGPQGIAGPPGAAGATGPQGPQGLAGNAVAGPQGPIGPQGPAGSPGLIYQGTYNPTKNYALGDVVIFNGSSYASLNAQNHGNTPDVSPGIWGALTAQGPAGPVGAAGPMGMSGVTGPIGPTGPPGERGDQGLQGIAGQAGAQGLTGATGAQGLQGPAGPQGATGPVGLAFQGAYSSTKNYGLADGVTWQGAGWVSLIAQNHGNTPDQSPAAWAMFAAAGAPGATGSAGPQGAAGAAGANGAVGATGPQGPVGPAGAAGKAGLIYRSAYSSVTNYDLGDVVLWNGSSYASLVTQNHGNTPDQSPTFWGLLTAQGAAGPVGPAGVAGTAGPQGPLGPVGPPGERGDQGQQGIPGQAGAQGIPGVAGPQGAAGITGAEGPAGPVGLAFKGAYNSTTNYGLGDGVLWQGAGWVSQTAQNHGNTPDQSPAFWQMFAAGGVPGATGPAGPAGTTGQPGANGAPGAIGPIGPTGIQGQQGVVGPPGPIGSAGPQGIQGPAGTQGLQGDRGPAGDRGDVGPQGSAGQAGAQGIPGVAGPQGTQGVAGPQGPTGATGLNFKGAYDSLANYAVGDGVLWQGAGWVSMTGSNHGNTPDQSPSSWLKFAEAGSPGAAGTPGAQGTAGAQGPAGPAGPQGTTGATGLPGTAGRPGLVFIGAYDATSNYAVGDVVYFSGSSYVSLTESNHGNTPGLSPTSWSPLTAEGAVGPQGPTGSTGDVGPQGPAGVAGPQGPVGGTGPQGIQGPAGAQGLRGDTGPVGSQGPVGPTGQAGQAGAQGVPGVAGPQGPQGSTGIQGPSGPVGLTFIGAYDAQTTYPSGDGVLWQGAGYVSLQAMNHGNTPDQSPTFWKMFAAGGIPGAQGAPGPVGATGDVGPIGPQGPAGTAGTAGAQGQAGAAGPQGPAGPTGAVGSQGPAGVQGLKGDTGAAGAQGPAGPQGLAGQAGAQGITGAAGAAGPQGPAGDIGPAGPTGVTGAAGQAGPVGMNFRNLWQAATHYVVRDAVTFGGGTYLAQADSTNQQPDVSPDSWSVLAMPGAVGQAGPAGAAGPTGPEGPAGATGPQGSTGAAGAAGPQGAAGTAGATGTTGLTGPQGAAGPVGMNFRAAWQPAIHYATRDVVTYSGSTYFAQADNTNQSPDVSPDYWALVAQVGSTGATGSAGAAGVSPSVSIGTVSTLTAGSAATVSNTGTGPNVILNFGIPQGAAGTGGGAPSTSSSNTLLAFHSMTNAKPYLSVSSPNVSGSEAATDPSALTWIPKACSASRLDVYSTQTTAGGGTLRIGSIGAMATTALTCTFAAGAHSCTVSGPVSVADGSFIDVQLSGSTSSTTFVWTSLQCDPQ